MAPGNTVGRKAGDRKRAAGEEVDVYAKRTPEETLAKFPFTEPKEDDKCAEFRQHFLGYQSRALILNLCDECCKDTQSYSKSCIHTARRNSQTQFFNIALKNMNDKVLSENN